MIAAGADIDREGAIRLAFVLADRFLFIARQHKPLVKLTHRVLLCDDESSKVHRRMVQLCRTEASPDD